MLRIKRIKNFYFIISLFVLVSCAHKGADNSLGANTNFVVQGQWYKGPEAFQFFESNEQIQTHPFFDVDHFYSKANDLINYLPITVKGSNVLYDLDLHSGKLFKVVDLCLQDDVWGTFSPKVQSPSFTLGIVPRATHRSLGATHSEYQPLRVAVFHQAEDREIKKDLSLKEFSRTKILGSFYLEECSSYPCRSQDSWKKELVLVGVNIKNQSKKLIEDSAFSNFESLLETKDWKEAKVFFHSQLGVHRFGKNEHYPRYRIVKASGIEETRKRFSQEILLKSYDEIMGERNKCRALFDQTWNQISQIRKSNDPREELKKFTISIFKEDARYELNRCLNYVRPANINTDAKRFWFFQFLRAATILEQSGFYYNCSQSTWYPNPRNADSKALYSTEAEVARCRSREAEYIYEKAIIGLGLMENQVGFSYRFTEYDTQSGGSHQKIYSWLPSGVKRLECKPSGKINLEDIFPEDVNWEEFPDGKQEAIH